MSPWGEEHKPVNGGAGTTGDIEDAHAALDKENVPRGLLAPRVLAYIGMVHNNEVHPK